MPLKFSLAQLLELMAIVGVTLAIDRLPPFESGLRPLYVYVVGAGSAAGVYLALRWSAKRDTRSLVVLAGSVAAVATFLNATLCGVMVAETLRGMNYFRWNEEGPVLLAIVIALTVAGTVLSASIMLVVSAVGRLWNSARQR